MLEVDEEGLDAVDKGILGSAAAPLFRGVRSALTRLRWH